MDEKRFQPSELEIKILEKLMLGTTDAAIARALRIADRTVRLHISKLQSISRVRGRFTLGAVAQANGWIQLRGRVSPEREALEQLPETALEHLNS